MNTTCRLVNFIFTDTIVPVVNSIFANGIPLPSVDGVTLTDTAILWGAEFVTIGSDFTFSPTLEKEEALALAAPVEAAPPAKRVQHIRTRLGARH